MYAADGVLRHLAVKDEWRVSNDVVGNSEHRSCFSSQEDISQIFGILIGIHIGRLEDRNMRE